MFQTTNQIHIDIDSTYLVDFPFQEQKITLHKPMIRPATRCTVTIFAAVALLQVRVLRSLCRYRPSIRIISHQTPVDFGAGHLNFRQISPANFKKKNGPIEMIYDMNWVLEFWEVNLDISFLLIFYNRNVGTDEGGVGKHVQIELFL